MRLCWSSDSSIQKEALDIDIILTFNEFPDENANFFTDMKTLVEDTYNKNNKTSVTLLVHSMGGLMAMHFLRLQPQKWKDQYIRRLISLSTPWGGSMKAVKVFAIGE